MKTNFRVKYVVGLLAIVVGAVATFDTTYIAELRYLAIFLSLFVIALILIDSMYVDNERNVSKQIQD